jgi:hypothetical protein
MTAMTLSNMIRMDGDLVDEGTGQPLGADQDADRIGASECNHTAAAPHLKVANVIRATKPVGTHADNSQRPTPKVSGGGIRGALVGLELEHRRGHVRSTARCGQPASVSEK